MQQASKPQPPSRIDALLCQWAGGKNTPSGNGSKPTKGENLVYLSDASGARRLVYAASWWSESDVGTYLSDVRAPIWTNLMAVKAPLHRSLSCVYLGNCPALEAEFGIPGPFWARHYLFYVNEAADAHLRSLLERTGNVSGADRPVDCTLQSAGLTDPRTGGFGA